MSWFNNMSLRLKLWLSFGTGLILLSCQHVLVERDTEESLAFFADMQSLMTEDATVTETLTLASAAQQAFGDAVLTGRETDMQRFEAARAQLKRTLTSALELHQEKPVITQRLKTLETSFQQWEVNVMAPAIAKRREILAGNGTLLELARIYEAAMANSELETSALQLVAFSNATHQHLDDRILARKAERVQTNRIYSYSVTATVLLGMLSALVVCSSLSTRLNRTVEVLEGIAAGDFNQELVEDGQDEVGRIQAATNLLTQNIGEKVRQMLDIMQSAADGDLTRPVTVRGPDPIGQMGEALERLMTELRHSIGTISLEAEKIGDASQHVKSISHRIREMAEQASQQTNAVSIGSDEVSRNVQSVATATKEMSGSIREIAKNAADAAKVATEAVKVAATTNKTITKLGDSSAQIGNVVRVITTIAQQTNLLALNATIEAARAGEAGKGFAVVANEVKALAQETARATEDISRRVEAIQADSRDAVEAIAQISNVINNINDISSSIASAVEEQTATTNEITRSVTEAARGSAEIVENIEGVADVSHSTAGGIRDIGVAAEEFALMAVRLQEAVSNFKVEETPGLGHPAHSHRHAPVRDVSGLAA